MKGNKDSGKNNSSRATKGAGRPPQSKPKHKIHLQETQGNERVEMLDTAKVGPITHQKDNERTLTTHIQPQRLRRGHAIFGVEM